MARLEDLIRKTLDKELNTQEEKDFREICQKGPGMIKEIEEFQGAIAALKGLEKAPPPADFVTQVMRSLPDKAGSTWIETFYRVLFTTHSIRWNLASALACGLVVIIALTVFGHLLKPPVETAKEEKKVYLVKFILSAPQAEKVSLAGDFNNWEENTLLMTNKEGEGLWTITLPLNPGTYNYMFIVNGKEWVSDPYADYHCDDGFGHKNAVLRIRGS